MQATLRQGLRMRLPENTQLLRAHARSLHSTTSCVELICLLHRLHLNPVEGNDIVVTLFRTFARHTCFSVLLAGFCLVIIRTTKSCEKALAARVIGAFAAFARVGRVFESSSFCKVQKFYFQRFLPTCVTQKTLSKTVSSIEEHYPTDANSLVSHGWMKQARTVELKAIPAPLNKVQPKLLLQSAT